MKIKQSQRLFLKCCNVQSKLPLRSPLPACDLSIRSIVYDTLAILLCIWLLLNGLCPMWPWSTILYIQMTTNIQSNVNRLVAKSSSMSLFIAISSRGIYRPAYLYRFSRDIPILALNHDFPISCGGVPILEDAGIFRLADLVLFCSRRYFLILSASCTYHQSGCCVAAINSPPQTMNKC